jgi:peptidoglycan/xylan/chitin deacetylase (PgdA/CDA1 family)
MKDPSSVSLRRIVKCAISLGVAAYTTARDFLLRACGIKPKSYCVILNYHSIPSDERHKFARQMDAVLRHSTPVEIQTEALPAAGARYVGITFDDGFENFISVALPELQRRNIPSTVFIILDALGNEFGTPELLERVMSADQLRRIPQDIVTLGSHTLTHPFLPSLKREEAVKELLESRLQLERILSRSVTLFSFPFGGFTDELIQLSRQAGYARVFTTLPRLAFTDAEQFAVGRIRADTTDWPLEFRLKIAGAYRWLPWAFAVKRRLLNNKLVVLARGVSRKSETSQQIPSCLIRKPASSVEV